MPYATKRSEGVYKQIRSIKSHNPLGMKCYHIKWGGHKIMTDKSLLHPRTSNCKNKLAVNDWLDARKDHTVLYD